MAKNDAFRATLGEWAGVHVPEFLLGVARISIQDTAEMVVDYTPVDTGFLVGNWQPGLNEPDTAVDISGTGNGYAASKIGLTIVDLKLGDMFFYTNNAVYARRINYGFVGKDSLGRYYNQRGVHMVEQSIAAWDTTVAEAAAKMQGGQEAV